MKTMFLGAVALAVMSLVGCSSDTTEKGSGSGGSSSTSSGSGAGKTGSGGGLMTGQCRNTDDCPNASLGDTCVTPDFDVGCGACQEPPMDELCIDDQECKAQDAQWICAPVQCPCSGSANTCVPGCTNDDDCAEQLECDSGNRCSARTCSGDDDCPANYSCTTGSCARRACTSDTDCDDYCVGTLCYGNPGWCWDGSAPP